MIKRAIVALFVATTTGCATLQDPIRADLTAPDAEVAQCAAWYRSLDQAIDRAGVRDAGGYRIPGFPYLRVDRFAASFRGDVSKNEPAFPAWITRLRQLEDSARTAEMRNLPAASFDGLGMGRDQAEARTRACAARLAEHDLSSPEKRALLVDRAQVPDDYVTWQRGLGLYAITRLGFASGIRRWQKETLEDFRRSKEDGVHPEGLSRYVPQGAANPEQAKQIFVAAASDPLGIPVFSDAQRDALFDAFAPVIEVENSGDFDRIGALAWGADSTPTVDTMRPTVYRRLGFARYHNETLVQLIYLAWFSERPHKSSFDMLAGRLDGIVWRVTLDRNGEPLVYDSIHPCGCFHMFFPTPRVRSVPAPESLAEWAFVPAAAPFGAERVVLRLATRTHYIVDVAADPGDAGQPYLSADYDELRSLPLAGGMRRSVFRPDGLVLGSERGERVFFWPMGVPSAGAMRQWGHHATAFVGRRHFDDADLIERRFDVFDR